MLHRAKELMASGKPEEARKDLTKALSLWPDNDDARKMLDELNKCMGYGRRELVDTIIAEGDSFAAQKKYDQAAKRYDEALKADPGNERAAASKARALQLKAKGKKFADIKDKAAGRHEVDSLHTQAVKYYEAGELKKAREIWQGILDQDPANKLAQTWLEETKAAYDRQSADAVSRVQAEKRSDSAQKLLSAPITISTDRKIPLSEFMKDLSFATPIELEYYIVEGANAMIFANFSDKPLREVLDTVLVPRGLAWAINEKNVITIEPNFVSKTYNLSPSQMAKIRSLLDSSQLQKIVWDQTDPPAEGVALTLDERQNMLVVTGSALHIKRVEGLLPTLQVAQEQEMIMRIYKIKEKDGPRIKALINSIIASSSKDPAFDMERKILIDQEDLIVREQRRRISRRSRSFCSTSSFIQNMRDEKLDIQSFSPRAARY